MPAHLLHAQHLFPQLGRNAAIRQGRSHVPQARMGGSQGGQNEGAVSHALLQLVARANGSWYLVVEVVEKDASLVHIICVKRGKLGGGGEEGHKSACGSSVMIWSLAGAQVTTSAQHVEPHNK